MGTKKNQNSKRMQNIIIYIETRSKLSRYHIPTIVLFQLLLPPPVRVCPVRHRGLRPEPGAAEGARPEGRGQEGEGQGEKGSGEGRILRRIRLSQALCYYYIRAVT